MNNDLRRLIIRLIRFREENNKKFTLIFSSILIVSFIMGLLVDRFLGNNILVNVLKSFIVLSIGISIFSFYRTSSNFLILYLTELRKIFSRKQRINLAILVYSFIAILTMFIINTSSSIYTIACGLLFSLLLVFLDFTKETAEEYMLDIYGLVDKRNIDHDFFVQGKLSKKAKKKLEKE